MIGFGVGGLEIVAAQMRDEPPSLLARAPDVPPALVAIVERLLRKNPDERFPSALALHSALEQVSLDEAPAASAIETTHPAANIPSSATPAPRRRWPLIAILGVVAAIIVTVVVVVVVMSTATRSSTAVALEASAPVSEQPAAREPSASSGAAVSTSVDRAEPAAVAVEPAPVPRDEPARQASASSQPPPSRPPERKPVKPTPRKPTVTSESAPSPPPAPPLPPDEPVPLEPEPAPEPAPGVAPAPAPARARRVVRAIEAGPIWDTKDARKKCPKVCRAPRTWTGAWRTTVRGKQSTCDCESPAE